MSHVEQVQKGTFRAEGFTVGGAPKPCRKCGSVRSVREYGIERADDGPWKNYVECIDALGCTKRRRA